MDKISQRDAFWNKVYELAKNDKDIVVITADMGAPALDKFRRELTQQFVNVGIAEQNAITLASGLALTGKKAFTYAIAPFITLRCLEQIRVENAMMKIPITIVGVGAGFGYEDSGPTHHLIEDIAVMRALPNIRIISITDRPMAEYFAEATCRTKNFTDYIRLDRLVYPDIYTKDSDFSHGLTAIRESKNYYLLATGSMVHVAVELAKKLEKKNIDLGVIDIFTLPINKEELLRKISRVKKIISLEEHYLAGGFGSAVAEVLTDSGCSARLLRIGIPMDKGYCYKYGGRQIIRKFYGIDTETVEEKIKNFLI